MDNLCCLDSVITVIKHESRKRITYTTTHSTRDVSKSLQYICFSRYKLCILCNVFMSSHDVCYLCTKLGNRFCWKRDCDICLLTSQPNGYAYHLTKYIFYRNSYIIIDFDTAKYQWSGFLHIHFLYFKSHIA